jgi:hypothetical protein
MLHGTARFIALLLAVVVVGNHAGAPPPPPPAYTHEPLEPVTADKHATASCTCALAQLPRHHWHSPATFPVACMAACVGP